jgi:ATP-binding cassette, subfamily B, bacterial MsbA
MAKFQLDPRIRAELETQRTPILIGLIAAGIASALYGGTLSLTNRVLEDLDRLKLYRRDSDFRSMMISCGLIFLIFLVRYIFVRIQTYIHAKAVSQLTAGLRQKLLKKLIRLPVTYFNDKRSGTIQSVLSNDVMVFQNAVQMIRDMIEAPIKAIIALVTIMILQWQMAVMSLLLIPVLSVIIQRNSRKLRVAQTEVQQGLADITATAQETIQGIRVIKSFGAELQIDEQYAAANRDNVKQQLKAAKLIAALRPMVELLGAAGLVLAFMIGGWLALRGQMTVAKVATLAMALDAINQGFKGGTSLSNTYAGVQAAADRIYSEVLDVPEPPELSGTRTLENVQGKIEFIDVSFSYPDGTEALKKVSFTIEAGQSVALVGPSGAGKSTIADLFLRFYEPTSGQIFLDGVDIKDLDTNWLRSQIGVVPQQTFLFAGSIDENLKLGAQEAKDDDLRKALEIAHAVEFTQEFRERNVPVLGERGVKLSGGQMQRIAIARALVRDPKILLLDEATSALDAASETAVTEALQEVMTTRSTLFIAHRLTTAARADKIVLLKRGEVVEVGTHRDLLAQGGEYSALFKLFSAGVLDDTLD